MFHLDVCCLTGSILGSTGSRGNGVGSVAGGVVVSTGKTGAALVFCRTFLIFLRADSAQEFFATIVPNASHTKQWFESKWMKKYKTIVIILFII